MSYEKEHYDALVRGDVDRFENLLDEHPDLWSGEQPVFYLQHASSRGQLEIVRFLIRRGVDVNSPTDELTGPEGALVAAANRGHIKVVNYLLDNGATVNHVVKGKIRSFALTGAIVGGHFEVVKLLIERGADVNATGGRTTPLGYALMYNQPAIAEYLRSVGAKEKP